VVPLSGSRGRCPHSATDPREAGDGRVPAALRAHPVYRGQDPTGALSAVSDAIESHTMRLLGDAAAGETTLFGTQVGPVSLWFLEYRTPVEIAAPGGADCFCVQVPLAGSVQVRCGSEEVSAGTGLATVPAPSRPLSMRWSAGSPHLIIRIEREAVESALRAHLGTAESRPIITHLGLDLTRGAGLRWQSILDLLLAEIATGDDAGPLRRSREATLGDLVISTLLFAHPNSEWDALVAHQTPAGSPYVRRAVEYVRQELFTPLTTTAVAEAVGISVRALQAGFAREIGRSPSEYIREERLTWVHDRLLAARTDHEVTVTEVALQGGFSHLGRFAQLYRRRFGELPSETLRPARPKLDLTEYSK
jgi:AraC-like DNA-binding protein